MSMDNLLRFFSPQKSSEVPSEALSMIICPPDRYFLSCLDTTRAKEQHVGIILKYEQPNTQRIFMQNNLLMPHHLKMSLQKMVADWHDSTEYYPVLTAMPIAASPGRSTIASAAQRKIQFMLT